MPCLGTLRTLATPLVLHGGWHAMALYACLQHELLPGLSSAR